MWFSGLKPQGLSALPLASKWQKLGTLGNHLSTQVLVRASRVAVEQLGGCVSFFPGWVLPFCLK